MPRGAPCSARFNSLLGPFSALFRAFQFPVLCAVNPRVAGACGGISRGIPPLCGRSEEHTSELQSLMRISYAVFCLKNKWKILRKHPDYANHRQNGAAMHEN